MLVLRNEEQNEFKPNEGFTLFIDVVFLRLSIKTITVIMSTKTVIITVGFNPADVMVKVKNFIRSRIRQF